MPPYAPEPESGGRRRDFLLAGFVLLLALSALYMSDERQQQVSNGLQVTALRPFLGIQRQLAANRTRATEIDSVLAVVDSLTALLATHSAVVDENRTLRELLALGERTDRPYLPATILRPGTPGSESMFIVGIGSEDGVVVGSPVIGPYGLVGRIREVRANDAVGMDWTHPEFRAGAMIADGSAYGLVENQPGDFLGDDQLVLNGIPFNQPVATDALVVTSGLGGIYPRGVPIGRVRELQESEGSWRKSYFLTAEVDPGSATHVVVFTGLGGEDASAIWAEIQEGDVPGGEG
ncbi:MAG: rod shape-determining protein MreC [Gemmatimonadota bacterium]